MEIVESLQIPYTSTDSGRPTIITLLWLAFPTQNMHQLTVTAKYEGSEQIVQANTFGDPKAPYSEWPKTYPQAEKAYHESVDFWVDFADRLESRVRNRGDFYVQS